MAIYYRYASSTILHFPDTTWISVCLLHFHHNHLTNSCLVRGKNYLTLLSDHPLFTSPIANPSCTPPLKTILSLLHCSLFFIITIPLAQEPTVVARSLQVRIKVILAAKTYSTQLSQAKDSKDDCGNYSYSSLPIYSSRSSVFFDATYKLKHKNNSFTLLLFDSSKNSAM